MNQKKSGITFLDKFLFNIIENNLFEIVMFLALVVSVLIRVTLAPECELSPDYNTYYKEWVNTYREVGILKGFSMTIGDYYVPFNILYAISSLLPFEAWVPLSIASCLCEYVGAFFLYKILKHLLSLNKADKEKARRVSAVVSIAVLYIPTVVFNGALWKQCDSMYTCFILISVYYLLKDRYTKSFVFLGIAFAFKLQAIFVIPAFLIIYMAKKSFSILQFAWIPVIFLLVGLPAVLAHRGLRATYFMYFAQTQETQSEGYGMVSYLPNLYNFGYDDYDAILNAGAVLMVAFIFMISAYLFCKADKEYRENLKKVDMVKAEAGLFTGENIFYLVIWSAWTCCMFLPGMHERYDYMVIFMITGYAFAIRKKLIPVAICIDVISIITYGHILFKVETIPTYVLAVPYLIAYVFMCYDFYERLNSAGQKDMQ
ncbi:MAG: glycosyltransferase 87 family protein [Butyrivibrio sp.]|nr:glycosyltransferase 87 family protein [Butyrivibrio sp.]